MTGLGTTFSEAFGLLTRLDAELLGIVGLSLQVTLAALVIACLVGFPLGAVLTTGRFPGRRALVVLVNAAMGLPPVVVGLTLYLLFSAAGPLGPLDLLYTPWAMIVAQAVLVTPIVAALTRVAVAERAAELGETLAALRASPGAARRTYLWEARPALVTAALAGLGRALAEVGAVMIVGGNIAGQTRVMTTAIALETTRGELALALALGIVLLAVSLCLNALASTIGRIGPEAAHVR